MSYQCDGCGQRVFPTRTDYLSNGLCPDCGIQIVAGGGETPESQDTETAQDGGSR